MQTLLFARSIRWIFPALCVAFLAACTGTAKLKEGERLYAGAKVKLTKADDEWNIKILKSDLKKAVILPRKNKKLLWMRPRLSVYNLFHNRREKSLGNFIANRFGEEPVLYNPKISNRHVELIKERSANDGFFKVKTNPEEKGRKHSVKIVHNVRVEAPRKMVNDIIYPSDSTVLSQAIAALRATSLVKVGQPYHLEELIGERQRITDTLRNQGWYYFSPDNLLFEADSIMRQGELHLTLTIKKEVGTRERQRYRLRTVTIYPDYDLTKQSAADRLGFDTLRAECLTYVYKNLNVRPEVLGRQIFLRCGEYFSNDDYQSSIFRLLNLNLHKFINIRFEPSAQSDSLLDVIVNLTPYPPQRVEGSPSGVFSPGFYNGVRAGISYNHRNTLRGAEAFRIGWSGAYLRTNKNNFDFEDFLISDASVRMSMPRFLFLRDRQTRAFNTTQVSLRHEVNYFKYNLPDLGRFGLSFQRTRAEGGYLWKNNRRGSSVHEFNPLSLGMQYATMGNKSLKRQLISQIPEDTTGTLVFLLTFVEYQPNYTFTIDQRLEPARRRSIFFRQHFSGQISGYTRNPALSEDYRLPNPLNLFIESDYRQYQRTHGRNVLAMRLAAAVGIPLKKNSVVALLDRYAFGGASSVRAFPPRSVGPGVQPRDTTANNGLNIGLYTGNLLLEGSIEYRIPIGKYPELAVFVDAGNVWLTSGDDASPASQFRLNRFYKDLAVGTGAGLRVNLGFFVLRLDVAFPLAKPYLPAGERWVGDNIKFGSRGWRKENLNWNFSFGYPF